MDELLNAMKRHVAGMIGQVGTTRLATVTSVNPANHTAKVMIQPEGVLSGWLPIAAIMAGSDWGVVAPPSPGEQVVVLAQEGDSEHGIIVGRLFSNPQQPPKTYTDQENQGTTTPAQSGEVALVHKSGKFIRLIGDRILINGDLYVNGNVAINGNVTVKGTVHATQPVISDVDITDPHGTLNRLRLNFDQHVHPNDGPPVPQDPE